MSKRIINIEWWFDDANFHYDQKNLIFACLCEYEDSTYGIFVGNEFKLFANLTEANVWLLDEEFSTVDCLLDTYGLKVDFPKIKFEGYNFEIP